MLKLAVDNGIRLQLLESNTDVDGNNIKLEYDYNSEVKPRCLNETTLKYYSTTGHLLFYLLVRLS